MEICCVPSLMRLIIILLIPFGSSALQLSNRRHPHHLSNASDQEALFGFISAITYDPQSLSTDWKPNVSFCEWRGIRCSRRRQRVVSLNASSLGLQEYGLGGCVTTKGDVYSYGIVLLHMLTRKKPTDNMFVEGMNLQKWVSINFPNRIGEVVDRSILKRTNTITEEDKEFNCLNHLMSVGLLCTKESPEERPTMINIVTQLQSIKDTFLSTACNPNFQLEINQLLSNVTYNNTGEGQSSSTF